MLLFNRGAYAVYLGVHMSLQENLSSTVEDVVVEVTANTELSEDAKAAAVNTMKDQMAKVKAAVTELVRRGKESEVGKFVMKCIDNIRDLLSVLVGHVKELWAKLLAMFKKKEVLMLEYKVA